MHSWGENTRKNKQDDLVGLFHLTSIIFDLYTNLMPSLWWFISQFIYTPVWCPTPHC